MPLSATILVQPENARQNFFLPAENTPPAFTADAITAALHTPRCTVYVLQNPHDGGVGIGLAGALTVQADRPRTLPLLGILPPLYPEWLGDRSFNAVHGTRFPYVAGAMANGIASVRLVMAMAHSGCLAFFGAAGLSLTRVAAAIDELQAQLDPLNLPWGVNLIHSPADPELEAAVAELLLRKNVRCVEASAYLALTPAVVRYACTGLRLSPNGAVLRRNRLVAKVSRAEVARHFISPPPMSILQDLQARGLLTAMEVELAQRVPLAEDITAESDSGGHTDNRPLSALLPSLARLRDEISQEHNYRFPVRIGAAGGLGTPAAVAAAFALGAAYVQTGSVNQACIESALDDGARLMLASAEMSDVIMAPAADMFEMGVKVQVLRRGTLFAPRAAKLYELYRGYPALDAIPVIERDKVEAQILRASFADATTATLAFWQQRDPAQVQRAQTDPKHLMALVFRSYLGLSSRWAIDGVQARSADFQIWCGPAMGAFNTWTMGSFLSDPAERTVAQVARNLLEGAAGITRAQQLRSFGAPVPAAAFDFRPRRLA